MTRDEIMDVLKAHLGELQESYAVQSLALFGSIARDEGGPESDVDVVVTFRGMAQFGRFFGLKARLEQLLQRPVDLTTDAALKPRLRQRIAKDLMYVA